MDFQIANRISGVHGSMIRELFKLGADPNTISFGGGNPASETFPCEAIARGVLCVPGAAFLADESKVSNGFRLNFSTPTDEQIVKGIEILGALTHEWIAQHKGV